jgi:D-xylose 1-dehydrogenase (NADP+, D-xylono-1,5-lactone-forming)
MDKVRWGILGAAGIAQAKTLPGMALSPSCELAAIASVGNREKAAAMKDAFGIRTLYRSYEELLRDPSIEAVYLPLPNDLHFTWAREAALHGKHLLCEKPLTLDAAHASQLVELFRSRSLVLAEAFMYRHNPRVLRARSLIQTGRIGEPRLVKASFCFRLVDHTNIRFSRERGGGSLYDIGCYCVGVSRFLLGEEPEAVLARLSSRQGAEVDDQGEAWLDFPSGARACIDFSFNTPWHEELEVQGSEGGFILSAPFTSRNADPEITLWTQDSNSWEPRYTVETFPPVNDYTLQAESFCLRVRGLTGREDDLVAPADAIGNARTLDAIFASAGRGEHVKL